MIFQQNVCFEVYMHHTTVNTWTALLHRRWFFPRNVCMYVWRARNMTIPGLYSPTGRERLRGGGEVFPPFRSGPCTQHVDWPVIGAASDIFRRLTFKAALLLPLLSILRCSSRTTSFVFDAPQIRPSVCDHPPIRSNI